MNRNEGHDLPLNLANCDLAIRGCTNYVEEVAIAYDEAPLLPVGRLRLGFKHFTAHPISASWSPSTSFLHLTLLFMILNFHRYASPRAMSDSKDVIAPSP